MVVVRGVDLMAAVPSRQAYWICCNTTTRSVNGCAGGRPQQGVEVAVRRGVGGRLPRTIRAPAIRSRPAARSSRAGGCDTRTCRRGDPEGMLYSYWKLTPGLIEISTLSPLPVGLIHKPWVCRLVPLKQCGVLLSLSECVQADRPAGDCAASDGSCRRDSLRSWATRMAPWDRSGCPDSCGA